jgi:hypothetical protein
MLKLKDIKKGGLYKKGKTVYFLSADKSKNIYCQTITGIDQYDNTYADTKEDIFIFLTEKAEYLGQLKDKIQL